MESMNHIAIGVVGYSGQKFDEGDAIRLIADAFNEAVDRIPFKKLPYKVISGLTDLGIPGLAYREAALRGWITVGVACKKAEDYPCYPVDESHIVGEEWGDESKTFLGMLDILIRVGGGKQSLAEVEEAKKITGLIVIERELAAQPK